MPLALKPHATSIERAFSILEMLDGTRRGWNISEISRKQKIPKSSAHVIVLALERMGYLKRENGTRRYRLGLKICSLGRGFDERLGPSRDCFASHALVGGADSIDCAFGRLGKGPHCLYSKD